jgi:hypothetical protein
MERASTMRLMRMFSVAIAENELGKKGKVEMKRGRQLRRPLQFSRLPVQAAVRPAAARLFWFLQGRSVRSGSCGLPDRVVSDVAR